MTGIDRRTFLAGAVAAGASLGCDSGSRLRSGGDGFVCPPCGCAMDGQRFDAPGICPACSMTLAPADEAALGFEPAELPAGAGRFQVRGGSVRQDRRITVHYYRPEGFTPSSDILLVVPGSGRNGGAYRNAWLEPSIRSGTLVAALGYPESDYDFAAYQLGGVAAEVDWRNARIDRRERSTVVHLGDEDIEVRINQDASSWLFNDFDRIFEQVRAAAGSARHDYDLFGHSAGAQVLHRMVLFHGPSAARRIVAANAGFYTRPDPTEPFPLGLAGTGIADGALARAFGVELTLLLGELDNDDDAGGTLLHTPALDRRGLGRRDRGQAFFEAARRQAARIGAPFHWRLQRVPRVGHDHRAMSAAAARLLFQA